MIHSRNSQSLLPPANKVWGKVIFLHVCVILSTGGACMVAGVCAWLWGGVCGCWGACVAPGGMHGCRGACVVVGGMAGCRGCAWLQGVYVVAGGGCIGYDEIRSMSGWYASYWNAFLFLTIKFREIFNSLHYRHCLSNIVPYQFNR